MSDRPRLSGPIEDVEGVCAYAGHTWTNAGGGLLVCAVCDEEKWATGDEEDEVWP